MSTYTAIDLSNATKYSVERNKLRILNYLYKTRPNIISWLDVKITAADPENDYYYTEKFSNKAIKVSIKLTEHACTTISCNSHHPTGVCDYGDEPVMYRLGETNTYTPACQPACYHMRTSTTHDGEGRVKLQSLRTKWSKHNDVCAIVPIVASYMELPLFRSKERYEARVNDLTVGFDEYINENDKNTVSGVEYKFNEYYCNVFDTGFDAENKTCYNPPGKWLYKNLVGGYMVALVKAGIYKIENGTTQPIVNFEEPVPAPGPHLFYENWRNDINPAFVLPPVDITLKDLNENAMFRTLKGENNTFDAFIDEDLTTEVNFSRSKIRKKRSLPAHMRRHHERTNLHRTFDEDFTGFANPVTELEASKPKPKIEKEWYLKFGDKLIHVLQSLLSPDFLEIYAANKALHFVTTSLNTALNMIMNKFVPMLITRLAIGAEMVMSALVEKSLEAVLVHTTMNVVINLTSKVIVSICTMLTELASFFGSVLIIVNVLDLLLSFWDPLNFNEMFNAEFLKMITFESEMGQRIGMGMSKPVVSFELLCALLLSVDERMELAVEVFADIYDYLDSLTVNSEGGRIDKGDVINPRYMQKHDIATEILAKKNVYTPVQLNEFEEAHKLRMSYFGETKLYLAILAGIAFSFLIMEVWVGAIIFFILCMLLVWSNYLNSTVNIGKFIQKSKIRLHLK